MLAAMAACVAVGPVGAVAPGDAAPPLALPDESGATVSLDVLRGRVVYVDFWAFGILAFLRPPNSSDTERRLDNAAGKLLDALLT